MSCLVLKSLRRKGLSIVECVILMIVLGISIWAVMSTALWTVEMETFARAETDARLLGASMFEHFEAVPPSSFEDHFSEALEKVIHEMGGNSSTSTIHGYHYKVVELSSENGVRVLELTLTPQNSKKTKITWERHINGFSHETVEDPTKKSGI